jgi:hypothetical protein
MKAAAGSCHVTAPRGILRDGNSGRNQLSAWGHLPLSGGLKPTSYLSAEEFHGQGPHRLPRRPNPRPAS